MSSVTVYELTKGYCPKCKATIRRFQKHGIEPEVLSVEDNMTLAMSFVPDAKAAPIVVTDKGCWSDLNYDKIDAYANAIGHRPSR